MSELAVVRFDVEDESFSGGRRIVVDEFPGGDDPATTDLGRKARRFRVGAFLLGDDVAARRDALIKAAEQPGPGPLIHPRYGRIDVVVESFEIAHSTRRGRFADLSFEFVKHGTAKLPANVLSSGLGIPRAAAAAKVSILARFAAAFDAVNDFEFVGIAAVADASAGLDTINAALRAPGAALARNSAALAAAMSSLADNMEDLIATPGILADQISNSFDLLLAAGGDVLSVFRDIAASTSTATATNASPARQQALDNRAALNRLNLRLALIGGAEATADASFSSLDEAETIRDDLSDRLADTAADDTDRDTFDALTDLRAALVAHIEAVTVGLPREKTITPPVVTSTWQLAQDLYGDGLRAQEIADRNDIAHPGFVGAQELRVLAS